jgi:ssDNA-binding Zn-finger/Zn-ribbon topoisomerase 1
MIKKGDVTTQKCKKCGTFMVAASDPFKAVIFGKKEKVLSVFTKCPKCGQRGILRLE